MFDEKAVYIGSAEVCPIALVFNALDHIEHLPAIANLASDSAGGLTIEAFGSNACEIPAVMARVPAAVNANIVTDQVTGRGSDRQLQRIGLDRLWSEIRAKCGTAALIATMLAKAANSSLECYSSLAPGSARLGTIIVNCCNFSTTFLTKKSL